MGSNPTGFKITDTAAGWSGADFEDVFVRKDCFLEGGLWTLGGVGPGNNSTIPRSSPVQTISGGTNWKNSSSGGCQSGGVKTDGTLWIWGGTALGGTAGNNSTINRSSPVQTISGGTNWKCASFSFNGSAAIKTDGTLWTWGYGCLGALGNNSTIRQSSPVQTISGGTNWKSLSIFHGLFGAKHAVAIKTDGTLWTWGGATAANGDGTTIIRSSPVQTISGGTNWKSASMGYGIAAAIKTDGTLWTWGGGGQGALGNNATTGQSSPVQTISGGNNWRSVSAGNSVAAIKTDGTLWVWGTGCAGQLGTNSTINQSSPVQTVSGGTNWRSVSTFASFSLYGNRGAIKTDGTLWVWGENGQGALGNNATTGQSSPVQTISGGTNWRSVSMGQNPTAIREDCW
jgi:alpha-tubulin suppressor-like RCC1 family protein